VSLKDGQSRWRTTNEAARRLFHVEDFPWQGKTHADMRRYGPNSGGARGVRASDEAAWAARASG